ncbi:MAG: hybrid sensor histidine kinase/response regulator [Desulfovibrionales bacterium]|nr:hybrid sensor histidine kinase/response regulator [Desulfovibrionales bacterium]
MVNILVVDDEVDFADMLAERLRTRDMHVRTAYDGNQALDRVREATPDVVLLDITMPGLDGLSTLEHVKRLSPMTQVILITADSTVATAVAGMKRGACDYLIKPAHLDRVLQAIHEAETRRLDRLSRKRMAETAKLAALGELGKGVAHEINNPVHIMVNEAGWIEELLSEANLDPKTEAQVRSSLDLIRQQAKRCKTITSKLLTLRPVKGMHSANAALTAIWANVLAQRTARLHEAAVQLQESWDAELGARTWSESEWTQVLGSMLDNALDALDAPGGSITVSARIQDAHLVLTMEDTGHGMEEHVVTRIFEPFFSTKDVGKGVGLGLAICHGIIEAMDGSIAVRSTQGSGTIFTITVPIATDVCTEHLTPDSTGVSQGGTI